MNHLIETLLGWLGRYVVICPKTKKIVRIRFSRKEKFFLFPLIGIVAIIWFLVRVIPKPSRLAYPCQQISAGIGGSFLAWVVGALASLTFFRRIKPYLTRQNSPALAGAVIGIAAIGISVTVFVNSFTSPAEVYSSGLNAEGVRANPVGVAKGLSPGRVVWIRDTAATSWDGKAGAWWSDASISQTVVNRMMSSMLQAYANTSSDSAAWLAIFKAYNNSHGRGDIGYQPTEKIAIKINANPDKGTSDWDNNSPYSSPQVIYALVAQLIDVMHVPGANITITDPQRCVGDPIYDKIRANSNPQYQAVWFADSRQSSDPQRVIAAPDENSALWVKAGNGNDKKYLLPKCYTEATYLINLALLRPHRVFGVTLSSKNHFGSVYDPGTNSYNCGTLHDYAIWDYSYPNKMGQRHSHPYLTGHKDLGGKEVVYLIDGLYTGYNQGGWVRKWFSLGNDWASSMLISQDPVAIQSVGYDLISNEENLTTGNDCYSTANAPNVDNFLHEMALADNPPSGTVYDPEKDGTPLASLGVHEHWNNSTDKKYSRNLGTGNGIELIQLDGSNPTGSIGTDNAAAGSQSVRFSHAINVGNGGTVLTLHFPRTYSQLSLEVRNMQGEKCASLSITDRLGTGSFEYPLGSFTPGNYVVSLLEKNSVRYSANVTVNGK